ncbi:MAG TPA: hypothetical protein VK864_13955 [Longimicrobiales bacterium]|nr:hypothetical protein [Longimicrobiales bacterium]
MADYGWFTGLDLRFGTVQDEFAAFVGGEAALLLKRRAYLGIRGAGLATDNTQITDGSTGTEPLRMGYGGFLIGYIFPPPYLATLNIDALLGGGAAGHGVESNETNWDALFVFEVSATAELALARFARIGIGSSYRWVGDSGIPQITDSDLRGWSGLVRIRFGRF